MTTDDIRWQQMTSDDNRWHQMTTEDIRWHHMTSADKGWQQMIAECITLARIIETLDMELFEYWVDM